MAYFKGGLQMAYYENELYHFGVQGQRWGIRRYQNADGSLTPAGIEHYGRKYSKGIAKIKKKEKKASDLKVKSTKRQYKADKYNMKSERALTYWGSRRMHTKYLKKKRKASRLLWKSEKNIKSAAKIYKRLEAKYKDIPMSALNKADIEYGKKYANKVLY